MRIKAMSAILKASSLPLSGPYPTLDPFLFCVYHKDRYPAARDDSMEAPQRGNGHHFDPSAPYRMYHGDRIAGFPQHPHRGFETITATIDGILDHSDSLGNGGRYGEGDVQWMTAGKGVVHGEMFPLLHKNRDNFNKFFQIWLNLPRKSKMVDPSFAMFWDNDVPKWTSEDNLSCVTVWYGDYFLDKNTNATIAKERTSNPNQPPANSWAASPENDVAVLHIVLKPGGKLNLPKAHVSSVNRALYLIEGVSGGVTLNDTILDQTSMLTLDSNADVELKLPSTATTPSEFLLLQGKPIAEPVVQHGPFVMNTSGEIQQAFMDYQKTKFGGWPWPKDDMVFPRNKGRFALLYGKETKPENDTILDDLSCDAKK
jgi:redox-sensitive bicupin YhaK (pirin superfamily)